MKPKGFIILAAICAVLGGAAYFTLQSEKPAETDSKLGEKIFDNLPVNDVASIRISGKDGSVSLKKGDDVWVVETKYGYPADFSKIAELVKKIKEVKSGRRFAVSEDIRARLALNEPNKSEVPDDEKGTRITMKDETGKALADLIVGKAREASSGHGGHYLMMADSETVHLVDKSFRYMDTKSSQWIDKKLADVNADDVEKITCIDPSDGKTLYTLRRPEKKKDPELIEPVEGYEDRKLKTSKVNSMFRALSGMRVEDVADPQKDNDTTGVEDGKYIAYHLFDGTVYKVFPGNKKEGETDKYFVELSVEYQPLQAQSLQEEETKPDTDTSESESSPLSDVVPVVDEESGEKSVEKTDAKEQVKEENQKSPEELAAEAEELNKKIDPWTYVVSKWKFENFVTDPQVLFENEKEEKKTE